MSTKQQQSKLGPVAIALYVVASILGLFAMIAFIKTGQPLWGIPAMASFPAAIRLHANYFRRI
jgi:hypothetical protein